MCDHSRSDYKNSKEIHSSILHKVNSNIHTCLSCISVYISVWIWIYFSSGKLNWFLLKTISSIIWVTLTLNEKNADFFKEKISPVFSNWKLKLSLTTTHIGFVFKLIDSISYSSFQLEIWTRKYKIYHIFPPLVPLQYFLHCKPIPTSPDTLFKLMTIVYGGSLSFYQS